MVKKIEVGDTIVYRRDGKEYKIARVGRAIMVGPVFWFINEDGDEKTDARSKYYWNGLEWQPKERQW
jgi:phage gp45-like|tara:strand:+ start:147 stop:347 length:201 start_codon:yes stop_codon:yes gene_type:complete